MTLNRSADAWCSCEFSPGILAQISLVLLIWSKSEGQSFTYQNLLLFSFLCKYKWPITVDSNVFFLHQSCPQVLSSVWVSHLDKRRHLFCSRLTSADALAITWWCSIVTEPSAHCSMNGHCGLSFRTAYFLIFLQFWGAVTEAAVSLCAFTQIALRARLERNWRGRHIMVNPRLCPGRSGRRARKEERSAGQTCCAGG